MFRWLQKLVGLNRIEIGFDFTNAEERLAAIRERLEGFEEEYLDFRCFASGQIAAGMCDSLPEYALAPVEHENENISNELLDAIARAEKRLENGDKKLALFERKMSAAISGDRIKEIKEIEQFFSYAHLEDKHVKHFDELRNLASWNYFVFNDTNYFFDPKDWKLIVSEAIGKNTIFFLFWSKTSSKSESVRFEFKLAKARGAVVLVILMDDTKLAPYPDQNVFHLKWRTIDIPPSKEDVLDYHPISIFEELRLLGFVFKFISHFHFVYHKDLYDLIVLSHRLRPVPKHFSPVFDVLY